MRLTANVLASVDGVGGGLPGAVFFDEGEAFGDGGFVGEVGCEVDDAVVAVGCAAEGFGEVDAGGGAGYGRSKRLAELLEGGDPLILLHLIAEHSGGLFPAFGVVLFVEESEPFLSGGGGFVFGGASG